MFFQCIITNIYIYLPQSTPKAHVIDFGAIPNQLIAGNTPQSVVSQSTVNMLSNQMAGLSKFSFAYIYKLFLTLYFSLQLIIRAIYIIILTHC